MATSNIFTIYPQRHHTITGQHVGELWSVCGAKRNVPHDGLSLDLYIVFAPKNTPILTGTLDSTFWPRSGEGGPQDPRCSF